MRSSHLLVAALMAGLVTGTACGTGTPLRSATDATPAASSASADPLTSPSGTRPTAASGGRVTSPSPTVCRPAASTRALTGPVAAFFWSGSNGCITVTLLDAGGRISTVTTAGQHATQFVCHDSARAGAQPDSGLTPGPAYSVTNDRIYWWDGRLIHWLSRDGTQGREALAIGNEVGLQFATTPDDSRIVFTTVDFARWPLRRTTWIEDAVTRANKTVIFDGDLSTNQNVLMRGTSASWPWGWHGSSPVVYDFPLCMTLGGDQLISLSHPRVVDPSTGFTLVAFPECYGASITTAGVLCTTAPRVAGNPFTARTLTWFAWSGSVSRSFALPYDTELCDSDVSPSASRVLAHCERNRYTDPHGASITPQLVFGNGPAIPRGMQYPTSLRWLDDDLVLESRSLTDPSGYWSGIYVWSLRKQTVVAGPVRLPGRYVFPRQQFNPWPPPTRLLT